MKVHNKPFNMYVNLVTNNIYLYFFKKIYTYIY